MSDIDFFLTEGENVGGVDIQRRTGAAGLCDGEMAYISNT